MTSAYGRDLEQRYHTARIPHLGVTLQTPDPVVLTHIDAGHGSSLPVPPEEAFTIQMLVDTISSPKLMHRRRALDIESAKPGSNFIFDLEDAPEVYYSGRLNSLRLYMTKHTFRDIARENGISWSGHLDPKRWGFHDPIVSNLLATTLPLFDKPDEREAAFLHHVILALHFHLVGTYGGAVWSRAETTGTLVSWQMKRAKDFIEDHLFTSVDLTRLAAECGVSTGYFARSFTTAFGKTPYRYYLERRIEAVKRLMIQYPNLPLTDLSLKAGFSSHSHFTRVFTRIDGRTPSAWRRDTLCAGIRSS